LEDFDPRLAARSKSAFVSESSRVAWVKLTNGELHLFKVFVPALPSQARARAGHREYPMQSELLTTYKLWCPGLAARNEQKAGKAKWENSNLTLKFGWRGWKIQETLSEALTANPFS
jgi:hypothetical protein